MPEMPPPPPRPAGGASSIDSSIFEQETPIRQQAPADPRGADWAAVAEDEIPDAGSYYPDVAEPAHGPYVALEAPRADNPFLAAPAAPAAPRPPASAPVAAVDRAPRSANAPRVIPPANGAPLVARPGAVSPEVRDAHAEFRRGGWRRPLVLVLVAGAVALGMTLLPSEDKPPPTAGELSKAPPPAVIGRSLPPGRTSDEDVRAAEARQLRAKPDESAPASRPSDIPDEGEFANAFKASAK